MKRSPELTSMKLERLVSLILVESAESDRLQTVPLMLKFDSSLSGLSV